MYDIMDKCYTCKKFLQDTNPNKDWCKGKNCYALAGFPEYEAKDINKVDENTES